jgi:hypothetical protein
VQSGECSNVAETKKSGQNFDLQSHYSAVQWWPNSGFKSKINLSGIRNPFPVSTLLFAEYFTNAEKLTPTRPWELSGVVD